MEYESQENPKKSLETGQVSRILDTRGGGVRYLMENQDFGRPTDPEKFEFGWKPRMVIDHC